MDSLQWKTLQLIKKLEAAQGHGTSMITLAIPPKEPLSKVNQMLTEEMGTASNIKSRVNKQSVMDAIVAVQQKLRLYTRTPLNGLLIFCGQVTDDKRINLAFEPLRPVTASFYLCHDKFQTDILRDMLTNDKTYGFIIIDGHGCMFATLCGYVKTILFSYSVDLPNKIKNGGQSSGRFQRIRQEKRHNYVTKVCEYAVKFFIKDNKPNVVGLILAGSADFKSQLSEAQGFDPRLKNIVLKIIDVAYGGENGLQQAIDQSRIILDNVELHNETVIIRQYMTEIAQGSDLYCFGEQDTLEALTNGAVSDIIVWSEYPTIHDKEQDITLVEWFTQNNHGAKIHIVSDRTQEGTQFVMGFGGIGALLRYSMTFSHPDDEDDDDTQSIHHDDKHPM
jgi:peptide chain release factor subunit 1